MQHRYADLGSANSGLTATGWEQVEALATWLSSHETLGSLYCGPLLQSRLTAQRIGQSNKCVVHIVRELRPDALTQPVPAEDSDQEDAQEEVDQRRSGLPPIDQILAKNTNHTIALVLDGDTIRVVLRTLMQANKTGIRISHTGICGLCVREPAWEVLYVNRREHIPKPVIVAVDEIEQEDDLPEAEQDLSAVISIYNHIASNEIAQKADNDRERIQTFIDFADLPDDVEILDVGTGLGIVATMFAEAGASSVIGVDISPGMLEQAEYLRLSHPTDTSGRVSFRLARLQRLPFRDERFDAVSCRLVLNHFKAPAQVIQEFVRVLKPGGTLVIAELLSVDDPVKRATQNAIEERRNPSHVAARSAEQYDKLITSAGLEITRTSTIRIEREIHEWLDAFRTSETVSATVIDMIEAGMETDAAGIGAKKRGDRIEFTQRMYYLKAVKPSD